MKNNEALQQEVQDAIKWEPSLNAAEIGVTAKDGVITLLGIVDSYAKKLEAEKAAKSISGVKVVVEKIEIRFDAGWHKNDNDIALEVTSALTSNWQVPKDIVQAKVENGWITLEGELEWNFQKNAAKECINNLPGVRGVSNNITIKSETKDLVEKKDIDSALARNWSIDNQNIIVKVKANRVYLNGTVESWYQRDEAERIAWNAPGVLGVDNQLTIEYNS